MIEGTNASTSVFPEYENCGTTSMPLQKGQSAVDYVLDDLERRRENVLSGGINCVPWPFPRFRVEIPGIEPEQYIVVTAGPKVAKTQWASFTFIYNTLDYAFEHPEQLSVHIIYVAMEESVPRILQRYMSHLLWKFDGERYSPQDLRSVSAEYPLPEEAMQKLKSPKYQERLRFFEKCVQFETEDTNPTGILRVCEEYAKSVGVYRTKKIKSRGNVDREVEVFDSYEEKDPKHLKMLLIDHASLTDLERGMNTKQTIDKLSEYCVKYIRNRYKYNIIWIQQQAMESEGLDAIKNKRMEPTVATLGDTKYSARDANLVLSLFDPSMFGLPSYMGYKINDVDGSGLHGYARFMKVLRGRDGEVGGICPMYFDGATCTFEELPPPDDINAVTQYYNRVKNNKSYRQQRKLQTLTSTVLFFIRKVFKKR